MSNQDNINYIAPAVAAALLKGPHAAEGGATLRDAAKSLSEGVHAVSGVVEIHGHVKRYADHAQTRSTVNRKGMANVFNWALQRMSQVEYNALTRDLAAIIAGDKRDNEHAERVTEIVGTLTTTKQVACTGKVEWTGTMDIEDLRVRNDVNANDIEGNGLTLIMNDQVIGGE